MTRALHHADLRVVYNPEAMAPIVRQHCLQGVSSRVVVRSPLVRKLDMGAEHRGLYSATPVRFSKHSLAVSELSVDVETSRNALESDICYNSHVPTLKIYSRFLEEECDNLEEGMFVGFLSFMF